MSRLSPGALHKFIAKIEEKKKGRLSDDQLSILATHINHDDIEKAFGREEVHADQPILVVRALNLLAGPSDTLSQIFDDHPTDRFTTSTTSSHSSEPKVIPSATTNVTSDDNHSTHGRTATAAASNTAAPTPTPEELAKLSFREVIQSAVEQAKQQGLLDRFGFGWTDFIAELTASDFEERKTPGTFGLLEDRFNLHHRLGLPQVAGQFNRLIREKDVTTLTKLLGQLAGISSRTGQTSPPHIKEDGEPWTLDGYDVLSPLKLTWLLNAFSTWSYFVVGVQRTPLPGGGHVGLPGKDTLQHSLSKALTQSPSDLPYGDYGRVIYGFIPPLRLLEDTLTATRDVEPAGLSSDEKVVEDKVYRAIQEHFHPAASRFGEGIASTHESFAQTTTKAIEQDILNVNVDNIGSWFHLELLSRSLELWTHLRDSAPKAAQASLSGMSKYLASNPLTTVMMKHPAKGEIKEWDVSYGRYFVNINKPPSNYKVDGIWLWSAELPELNNLTSTGLTRGKVKPIATDEANHRYIFLTPGEYDVLGTNERFTVIDERPR